MSRIIVPNGMSPLKIAEDAKRDILANLGRTAVPKRAWERANVVTQSQNTRPSESVWHLTCKDLVMNAALASSAVWLVAWGLEVNMLRGGITNGGGQKAETCALFMDVKTGLWTVAVAERNLYLLQHSEWDRAEWGKRRQEFITMTLSLSGRNHKDIGQRDHLDSIISTAVAQMERYFDDPALRDYILTELRKTKAWGEKLRMGRLKRMSRRTGRFYYDTTTAIGTRLREEI